MQPFSPHRAPAYLQPCSPLGLNHLLYETGVRLARNFSNISVLPKKDKSVERSGSGFGDLVPSLSHLSAAWGPAGRLTYLACRYYSRALPGLWPPPKNLSLWETESCCLQERPEGKHGWWGGGCWEAAVKAWGGLVWWPQVREFWASSWR